MPISSPSYKRTKSLLTNKVEKEVDVDNQWKKKGTVKDNKLCSLNTSERIFKPASNVDRNQEDGCMKKLKLERSLKLRKEDTRGRTHNILGNHIWKDNEWIDSFGDQKKKILPTMEPTVEITHDENKQIASAFSKKDEANEGLRIKMDYQPKK